MSLLYMNIPYVTFNHLAPLYFNNLTVPYSTVLNHFTSQSAHSFNLLLMEFSCVTLPIDSGQRHWINIIENDHLGRVDSINIHCNSSAVIQASVANSSAFTSLTLAFPDYESHKLHSALLEKDLSR